MSDAANTAGLDVEGVRPAVVDPTLVEAVALKPASEGVRQPDPARARCTAFQGQRLIASGELAQILPQLKAHGTDPAGPGSRLLVFEDSTSRLIEVDLRDSDEDALRSLGHARPHEGAGAAGSGGGQAPRAAGRPRLGVVAREVTLLPRHWEWLNRQPGGASVALRRLVDEARKAHDSRDRVRQAQEVTYRFLLAMGGDLPGYEEALRALFAGKREPFEALLASWPGDVRDHALRLAAEAFPIAT